MTADNVEQQTAIPAATIVLFRDTAVGPPELLMIERGGALAFAAGALVFPGGRVDPGDRDIAADPALVGDIPGLEPDDIAARVAGIRETIEEVGIAIGFQATPDEQAVIAMRNELRTGADFAGLLRSRGLRLDVGQLSAFARWRPDIALVRVFDARFYIAAAPPGSIAHVDGDESVQAIWTTAQAALDNFEAGLNKIIFPTRRNLERLARFASFAEARADTSRYPVRIITPQVQERDGEKYLCIREDHGYPVTSEPLELARRQ